MEFTALSDLARNMFCLMTPSTASEQVFSMSGHVMSSRRAKSKSSSVNKIAKKEVLKGSEKVCFT